MRARQFCRARIFCNVWCIVWGKPYNMTEARAKYSLRPFSQKYRKNIDYFLYTSLSTISFSCFLYKMGQHVENVTCSEV